MVSPSAGAATTLTASTASASLAGVEALGAGWVPQPPGGQGPCQCFGASPPVSIATPVGTSPAGNGIRSDAGIRVYTEDVRTLREAYRFFDDAQAVEALIQAIEAGEEKHFGK